MKFREVSSHGDWKKIKKLYISAFPECERKPMSVIRYKKYKKAADVWVIEEDGVFVGLAITMNGSGMVLLDYFAIADDKRGKGCGGKALRLLQDMYASRRFFLEIERTDVEADNITERKRRKTFYLQNGMSEMGVYARLFGVDMELLGYHCDVSFDEYYNLYTSNYGRLAEKNVVQLKSKKDMIHY